MGYRIGIDVGGTFTDFSLVRQDGEVVFTKSATTPMQEAEGVLTGLGQLAEAEGTDLSGLLSATDVLVHSTTTADNTLITMGGAPTGLITTEGHRDEIELRRGYKEKIWDPSFPAPPTIAKRRFRMGVPGRLDCEGNVLTPLDEEAVRRAARRFKKHGISSVAVCLLFSFVDSTWEKRVREIVVEEYPEARVYLSHEVMPAPPEFERTSTTLVNAFVGPRVVDYLQGLAEKLKQAGLKQDMLVMQSNGGIATVGAAEARPIVTLASGPVGGVMACARTAGGIGVKDFIGCDMGGTSYDVALVKGGEPVIKNEWNWISRYCIGLPVVDVLSIGAGGGSIATVKAGALSVGPESAGSEPGPICYDRGGEQVTVTDANVVLGYLNPSALCGGDMALDTEGVEKAIQEQIADPLGISVLEAAAGVHRLTIANMNNAIRRVSSERGHDPRKFDLVAFGGNGAMHGTGQALDMGIERVVVPRLSPVFCAYGVLCADYVVDLKQGFVTDSRELDREAFAAAAADLKQQAREELAKTGVGESDIEYRFEAGCRYTGQTFTISVPVGFRADGSMNRKGLRKLVEDFHELHEQLHTFKTPEEPVVIAELTLRAVGVVEKPPLPRAGAPGGTVADARTGSRKAFFEGQLVDTPVYDGARLGAGAIVQGPAIIEETFTTVLIHPPQQSTVDEYGNHVVTAKT